MDDRPHPDLRILTDLDDSNCSSSSERIQAQTFQLSPSVLAVGAFLEDIGDPRCLLHEAALAPIPAAATSRGPGAMPEVSTHRKSGVIALPEQIYDTRAAIQGAVAARTPIVPRHGGGRDGGKRRATATSTIIHSTKAFEKREPMANPSRDRLKEELVHLKGKAINLERELLRLKSKPKSSAVPAATPAAIGIQRGQLQTTPNRLVPRRRIWERLANGAKDRKRSSEMENGRLREVVDAQTKLSKTLQRMFTKAANPTVPGSSIRLASSRVSSAEVDPSSSAHQDDHVFQELVSQLDLQYQLLNIVQSETGLTQQTKEGQRSQIRPLNSDGGTLIVECCDVKHFPFAMDTVADAGWRCMTTEMMKDVNYTAKVVRKTDNFALTTSTIVAKTTNEPDRILRAKSAMKRFSEPERRVLLFNSVSNLSSRTYIDNQEDNQQATNSGLHFSDQGWATIESISDDSRWPACILRVCIRVRLQEQPTVASRNPESLDNTSLSELLADTYAHVLHARHQIVENFVLEDLVVRRH